KSPAVLQEDIQLTSHRRKGGVKFRRPRKPGGVVNRVSFEIGIIKIRPLERIWRDDLMHRIVPRLPITRLNCLANSLEPVHLRRVYQHFNHSRQMKTVCETVP